MSMELIDNVLGIITVAVAMPPMARVMRGDFYQINYSDSFLPLPTPYTVALYSIGKGVSH